jgi:xanthine/uracil permease
MIVMIIILSVYAKGFIRTLSLFVTMVIGYIIAATLGLLNFQTVADASWVAVPNPLPYGGLQWPGLIGVVTVIVCFFATAGGNDGPYACGLSHYRRSGRGLACARSRIE